MTWGSIGGTPLHIETDVTAGHGPTFKMPTVQRREQLARQLADKVTKSTRDKRKASALAARLACFFVKLSIISPSSLPPSLPPPSLSPSLSSPALLRKRLGTPSTPSERLQLLSPAARKLASRAATPGSVRGVDKALRRSYTPQHPPSSSASSSTPQPVSRGSTPRIRTSKGNTTPSLTDNLLNLSNR